MAEHPSNACKQTQQELGLSVFVATVLAFAMTFVLVILR
jgi:hypothetical protein